MITAIDTSVLLDIFGGDPTFGIPSKEAVRASLEEGSLIACEVVWAETASFFPSTNAASDAMKDLGLVFNPIQVEAALTASKIWKRYRSKGGKRTRVAPDFLIGAHALSQADRLLTRDMGFYRSYFFKLKIVEPPTGG